MRVGRGYEGGADSRILLCPDSRVAEVGVNEAIPGRPMPWATSARGDEDGALLEVEAHRLGVVRAAQPEHLVFAIRGFLLVAEVEADPRRELAQVVLA